MKKVKKIICLCTAFLMTVSLFSCSGNKNIKSPYSGEKGPSVADTVNPKNKNSHKLTTYYDEVAMECSTDYAKISSMKYAGDKLYLIGTVNSKKDISACSTNLDTLETSQTQTDSSIPEEMNKQDVYRDSKGKLYNCTYGDIEIYDQNMNLINRIDTNSIDGHEEIKGTFIYASTVAENGDIYIAASLKTSESIRIIKLNSSFEVQYVTEENDFSDCGDYIRKIFIGENGNPVLCTESDCTYINEISADSGRTVLRYEIPHTEELIGGYKNYDIIYRNGNTISGYNYLNDTSEELYSVDENTAQINTAYIQGSSLITEQVLKGNEKTVLTVYSKDGKEEKSTEISGVECVNDMCITDNGNIYILDENYGLEYTDDGVYETTQAEIIKIEDDGTAKTVYKGEKLLYETHFIFAADNEGNICIRNPDSSFGSDSVQITYINSDGTQTDMEYEANGQISNIIYANNKFQILLNSYDTAYISVLSVDKSSHELNKPIETELSVYYTVAGNNGYDFYYSGGNTIMGYKISDNSSEKIFSWYDTDAEHTADVNLLAIADSENIFYVKANYEYDEINNTEVLGQKSLIHLKKADAARLEELNSRSIITVAGSNLDNLYFSKIQKFNKTNNEYMIVATDYAQYDTDLYSENSAALSKLETDIAQGNIPDVIVGNRRFDIQKFLSNNALADLDEMLKNDPDIDSSNISENILNACKYNGKLYCIPYLISFSSIIGSEEVLSDSNAVTYDEFFDMTDSTTENTFIDSSRDELSALLVSTYISENTDFEKAKCSFQTHTFRKILETLKKCLPEEEYYTEKYEIAEAEGTKIVYPLRINYIGDINDLYSNLVGNDYPHISLSVKGIPSSSGITSILNINSYLSVTNSAENKEGAWEFIKFFTGLNGKSSEDEYINMISVFKSKNTENTEKYIKSIREARFLEYYDTDIEKYRTNVNALLNGRIISDICYSDICKIVNEEANKYYSDVQSVDETVSAIESKVNIYLSEIK